MLNPGDLFNWAGSKGACAVENGLTLVELHKLMDSEIAQQFAKHCEKFVKANPRVSVGSNPRGVDETEWARVNITSATQRMEVPPHLRKAIWMDTLTYIISEGIQISTDGMFTSIAPEILDREKADALSRPRNTPVISEDGLPF